MPPLVTETAVTAPLVTDAVAVAPVPPPSSVMETVTLDDNPEPPLTISMLVMTPLLMFGDPTPRVSALAADANATRHPRASNEDLSFFIRLVEVYC